MRVRITMDTDNAAFEEAGEAYEVARILRALAQDAEIAGLRPRPVRDSNGNTVGALLLSEPENLEGQGAAVDAALDRLADYYRQTQDADGTDVGVMWEIALDLLHASGRHPDRHERRERTYATEFPNFVLDVPIPEAWEDASWHNDACPSWRTRPEAPALQVFVDYADPRLSDWHDGEGGRAFPRFASSVLDEHGDHVDDAGSDGAFATNDWAEMLAFVRDWTERHPA